MKILHIAYSLEESSAAVRFAEMYDSNLASDQYFLLGRLSSYEFVRTRQIAPYLTHFFGILSHINNVILSYLFLENRSDIFSFGVHTWIKKCVFEYLLKRRNFDLICIHWIGYNFFPLKSLNGVVNSKIEVVAFLHDYYLLTGGCHVPMSCPEFKKSCNNCPVSFNKVGKYLIKNHRENKLNSLLKYNIKIVALSSYSESIVKSIYKGSVIFIPNTISNFYMNNTNQLEIIYNNYLYNRYLNLDIPSVLIVGLKQSKRNNKGLDLLLKSLTIFQKFGRKINLITIGEFVDISEFGNQIHFNFLTSNELKTIYENSDLTLVPSRYETFSQVTLESVLSLTPVVAFNLTGPKDIIINGATGFLVEPFNIEEFANVLNNKLDFKKNNKGKLLYNTKKTIIKYSNKSIFESFEKQLKLSKNE